MAFHVTQCPSCESTFNTNARLLESASGKVRCGACLTVFEAAANFVGQQPLDDGEDGESVFVGNNPLDYFNPSVFLTRSALREEVDDEDVSSDATFHEPDLGEDSLLDLSKDTTRDFFESVEEGIQASFHEPSINEPSINEPSIEEACLDSSKEQGALTREDLTTEQTFAIEPAATPAEDMETAGEHLPDEGEAPNQEDFSAAYSAEGRLPLATDEEAVEDESDSAALQAFAAHSITETETPAAPVDFPGTVIEAPAGVEGLHPQQEVESQSIIDAAPPAGDESKDTAQEHSDEDRPETQESIDPDSLATVPHSDDERPNPEDFNLSVSFSMMHTPAEPEDQDSSNSEEAAELERETPEEADKLDVLENQLNREIVEHDFQEAIADGLQPFGSEFETALFSDSSSSFSEHVITEEDALPRFESIEPGEAAAEDQTADSRVTDTDEAIDSTAAIRARALETELEDENALEAIPQEKLAALDEFETPVELTAGKQLRWRRQLSLSLLVLLLGTMLAGQFLWQRRIPYSQVEQIRPIYEWACNWLTCDLPVYSDIGSIRSDNLAVRSHPELENGLVVTVAFRNTANFPQPFPILVLSFNSASNDIVALREFAPVEYLDSALQSFSLMPVMSPVQFSLEIIDPGPAAVNYTLAFRRP